MDADDGDGARLAKRVSTSFFLLLPSEIVSWKTYKETEAKDSDEAYLLSPSQVQAAQCGQRQHEDGDIRDDVPGRINIPERQIRNTGSWSIRKPELVDRRAGEDDDQELRYGPRSDEDEGDDDDMPHPARSHDPMVLEQESKFNCC